MIELIVGIVGAFIAMYFLEGKLEVRERTHNFINRVAIGVRKIIHQNSNPNKQPIVPAEIDGKVNDILQHETLVLGVACQLGLPSDEQGARGLMWHPAEARDGDCELATLEVRNSGRITDNKNGTHYFYFRFNSHLVKKFRKHLIYIVVEYFDLAPTNKNTTEEFIGVAYDSLDGNAISAMFKPAGFKKLIGNNSWKEAVFSLSDGAFTNRANGADFRICLRHVNFETETELVIRRVAVIVME